ncbi:hypothetical protein ASD22_05765 [Rhodanobacter sp. Root480]|jgi:hypothetical protein|uniref:hypothetical protein n=1 Tax=Rhodanobacter sp. Root480 TaxID=1736542 RepID=UPI0006F9A507|nr:hypothetical protein [Rhodanobacter sp. Root480]KQX99740.1 hypothetical protein ASD22_05765 [Rhodanobacter sp. Root480]
MKSQNLIASIAAALFTFATLGAVTYNVDVPPAPAAATHRTVTDLPMIVVHPTAAERREAALINSGDFIGAAAGHGGGPHLSLVSSQLAMPYYSFANQFGGISKE